MKELLKHMVQMINEEITDAYNYFDMYKMYHNECPTMAQHFITLVSDEVKHYEKLRDSYSNMLKDSADMHEESRIFDFETDRLNNLANEIKFNLSQISR